jgi:hypothetical protein
MHKACALPDQVLRASPENRFKNDTLSILNCFNSAEKRAYGDERSRLMKIAKANQKYSL